MAYGFLFKKTSTAKKPNIDYLDELSEIKAMYANKDKEFNQDSFQDDLTKALSYLSKEDIGQVHVSGWLRDKMVQKINGSPESIDNEERKKLIKDLMVEHTDIHKPYRGNMGHKMIFSVGKDLEKKVEAAGMNLDVLLSDQMKSVMKSFEKKFHTKFNHKDKIGYAYGIHHDTNNRHIHVFLHNRTLQGRHVALSNPLKGKVDKNKREDQIGYVKEELAKREEKVLEYIDDVLKGKKVVPERLKALNSSFNMNKENHKISKKYIDKKLDELSDGLNNLEDNAKSLFIENRDNYRKNSELNDVIEVVKETNIISNFGDEMEEFDEFDLNEFLVSEELSDYDSKLSKMWDLTKGSSKEMSRNFSLLAELKEEQNQNFKNIKRLKATGKAARFMPRFLRKVIKSYTMISRSSTFKKIEKIKGKQEEIINFIGEIKEEQNLIKEEKFKLNVKREKLTKERKELNNQIFKRKNVLIKKFLNQEGTGAIKGEHYQYLKIKYYKFLNAYLSSKSVEDKNRLDQLNESILIQIRRGTHEKVRGSKTQVERHRRV